MPTSLRLHALGYTTPDGVRLFSDLTLSFSGERTGLVGRNGAGKSTLLRIMSGAFAPAAGSIAREGDVRLLQQSAAPLSGETIADAFGAREALDRLQRLETGHGTADDMADADWTLPEHVAAALVDAGLPGLEPSHPLKALSGGQRTRLALAALTFGAPALILLDEPTNNLDADGRAAVAELITRHRGGAVVASHDRDLLRLMDRIVEISSLGVKIYGGGWDTYVALRAEERAAAADNLDAAERRVRQVARDGQAARERQERHAQSGRKLRAKGGVPRIALGGMKRRAEESTGRTHVIAERKNADAAAELAAARAEVERETQVNAAIGSSRLAANARVLTLVNLTGGYEGAAPVIRNCSLEMIGPERVAITGANGSGKSTLLRLVTGALRPIAGTADLHVRAALLDQDVTLLDPGISVRDNFRRLNPGETENTCRAALARFMFRADAALQGVATLSGGEKIRAGLACVLGGSKVPGLIVLDEPTNHLDLHAVAAIENGLNAYDGAILVVSHDETFLDAIGITRRVAL